MPRFKNEDGTITFGPEVKEKAVQRPEGPPKILDWEQIQVPEPGHVSYAQLVGFIGLRQAGYRKDRAREIVTSPVFFEELLVLEITTVTGLLEDFAQTN